MYWDYDVNQPSLWLHDPIWQNIIFKVPLVQQMLRNKKSGDLLAVEGAFIVGKSTRLYKMYTPPKFNIEPENDGLEDDFPFPGVYSQVPC